MRTSVLSLSLAVGLVLAGAAMADQGACAPAGCDPGCGSPTCCSHCGRHCGCEKYCKLVCETREVKKTVWEVKCEEFCPLLPGPHCCCDCGGACPSGQQRCEKCCKDCCDPCAVEKAKNYFTPKCGHTRCKKTLVKKEVTCKVPAYKCVVVYCCPSCAAQTESKAVPAPGPAPAKDVPIVPSPSPSQEKTPTIAPPKPELPPPPPPPKTADISPLAIRLTSATE
jgi:hypothetical protein